MAVDEDAAVAAAIAASLEESGGRGGGGGGSGRPDPPRPPDAGPTEVGDVPAAPPPRRHRHRGGPSNGAAPTAVPLPDGSGRWLARRVVSANNSCLFASVGLLTRGTRDVAADLRGVVADAVLADPATYNEAVLEKPPPAYAAWVRLPNSWGGAIELSVLAAWAGVELAAGDIATQRVDVYGTGRGFSKRAWLVYDGLHYDAVCVTAPSASAPAAGTKWTQGAGEEGDERAVSVGSATAAAAAAAFATLLEGFHAARAFTDTARFTLRCGVCGAGVEGEKEAVVHAKQTGHANFQEY